MVIEDGADVQGHQTDQRQRERIVNALHPRRKLAILFNDEREREDAEVDDGEAERAAHDPAGDRLDEQDNIDPAMHDTTRNLFGG